MQFLHKRKAALWALALPLLVFAILAELAILVTGYIYQTEVNVPQGMKVLICGLAPLGALMLTIEMLKLPIAIWTASLHGSRKAFMVYIVLPVICLLTFQLVKDMAIYELNVNMSQAEEYRREASLVNVKIQDLEKEINNHSTDFEAATARLATKSARKDKDIADLKSRAALTTQELNDQLKRNDAMRLESSTLRDSLRKDLADLTSRSEHIASQLAIDSDNITKSLADLRARRDLELPRATKWSAEEARLLNNHKAHMDAYNERLAKYNENLESYNSANFAAKAFRSQPVHPGEPPARQLNRYIKPTQLQELDEQILLKETELANVNARRRKSLEESETALANLRAAYDQRIEAQRQDNDRARTALINKLSNHTNATTSALIAIEDAYKQDALKEQQVLDSQRPLAVIREELTSAIQHLNTLYTQRVAAIESTPIHRIATTVEIVKGVLTRSQVDTSKLSPKDRGDQLTHQIDVVRIWVLPVFAFIIAFLPAFLIELLFSALLKPQTKPPHRLGFFGRRLHSLYIRAGKHKLASAQSALQTQAQDKATIASQQDCINQLTAKLSALNAEYNAISADIDAAVSARSQELQDSWHNRLSTATQANLHLQSELLEAQSTISANEISTAATIAKLKADIADLNQTITSDKEAADKREEALHLRLKRLKDQIQSTDTSAISSIQAEATLRLQAAQDAHMDEIHTLKKTLNTQYTSETLALRKSFEEQRTLMERKIEELESSNATLVTTNQKLLKDYTTQTEYLRKVKQAFSDDSQ